MSYLIHYNDRFQGTGRLTPGEAARLTMKGYTLIPAGDRPEPQQEEAGR